MKSVKVSSNKSALRIPILYTNNMEVLTKVPESIMNLDRKVSR